MINNLDETLTEEKASRNPFLTPEGYFDNLTERIMSQIPEEKDNVVEMKSNVAEQKRTARIVPMRWARWAVACVCFVAIGTTAYLRFAPATEKANVAETTVNVDDADDAMMEAADYAMLDNHDVYQMLAEQ